MASEVDICNLALSNIRGGSINSLNEASVQAQNCKLKYPYARDQMLETDWDFARALVPLAVLSSVDVFNWAYAYAYPVDCLHIRRLVLNYENVSSDAPSIEARLFDLGRTLPDLDAPVEYEVFNVSGVKVIAANEPNLRIVYTREITDPNLFSNNFVKALSHLLASELAIPIVGADKGQKLRVDELQIYQKYLDSALAESLNRSYRRQPDSELITGRL